MDFHSSRQRSLSIRFSVCSLSERSPVLFDCILLCFHMHRGWISGGNVQFSLFFAEGDLPEKKKVWSRQ
ncbi:UNVERIFIED_CONTAM: hypothetical protein PYX00_003564 [Menopon gallinae]|uniref:Uncharacterized protein n=1 Tax=Menopon gallinae TaxID=328185 RepID=A0AAW2I0W8_9NEOP